MRVWDLHGAGNPRRLAGHRGPVFSVGFGPDESSVASGGADGTVLVYDTSGESPPRVSRGHSGPVRTVAFDSTGRSVATGGDDGDVRV